MYAEFLISRLRDEDGRGRSLQTRGVAVVTTSGTLVTLLAALAKLGGGAIVEGSASAIAARWLLSTAIALFVLAAIGGLAANFPRKKGRPELANLTELMKARWYDDNVSTAEQTVALARATALDRLETANDFAAWAVLFAIMLEVAAIGFAASAIVTLILST